MPPFRSTRRIRRGVVTASTAAVAVLAFVPGCGSASSDGGAPVGESPATTGDAAGAAPATTDDGAGNGGPASNGTADKGTAGKGTAGKGTADGGPAARVPGAPQAAAAVKAFYRRYPTDPSGASERYLTPELAARLKAGAGADDPAFCARSAPTSITYSEPVVSDGAATVTVITHRKGAPDRRIAVTVTVPDMLLSTITCPGS